MHIKQDPNYMIGSKEWVTIGLLWYKTTSIMQKGVRLANSMPILFINPQNCFT